MENSELYNNSDIYFDFTSNDPSGESNFQTIPDSEEEVSDFTGEAAEEEEVQESEQESETESTVIVNYDSDTLSHIDNSLNSFLGLFVATLVVVGIGLIIHFIWKLLNK